jgi:NAD-dependent DNA ligase
MDDRSELSIKNRDLQREIIDLKDASAPSQVNKVEMQRELQRGETSRDPYPKRGAPERVYDDTPEVNGEGKKEEDSEGGLDDVAQKDDLFSQKMDGDFKGLNIAVSGNYKNITRALLEEFITELQGKVAYAVNKKTSFLVLGHILEDGRQPEEGMKFKKAQQYEKQVYTEEEFENFCREKLNNPKFVLKGSDTANQGANKKQADQSLQKEQNRED